ncbi:hypothetical protein CHS0354_009553 [Potamilus streckersoni]|uniref:Uncharacterized protein n=1 Tax=Potamilus streckersoni TaxID=2493646 RepID=A0AAE0SNY9_9BIVA|nr:hypothetical protein CHS0354_009553 [Potamilus streckersoni]
MDYYFTGSKGGYYEIIRPVTSDTEEITAHISIIFRIPRLDSIKDIPPTARGFIHNHAKLFHVLIDFEEEEQIIAQRKEQEKQKQKQKNQKKRRAEEEQQEIKDLCKNLRLDSEEVMERQKRFQRRCELILYNIMILSHSATRWTYD